VLQQRWRDEKRERVVMVPETKEVERKFTVLVPAVREEKRDVTVSVPEMREETRQRTYLVMRSVPEVQTRQVCSYETVAIPVCDPCSGCVRTCCRVVPTTHNVNVTVYRCVPEQRT